MDTRYEKFDILRGFAIIGVVLIHITAPLATDGDVFSIIVNQMSRFAVPVFFFLSGWGLTAAKSYEKSERSEERRVGKECRSRGEKSEGREGEKRRRADEE